MNILLISGHAGTPYDPGATATIDDTYYEEATLNIEVVDRLEKLLRDKYGANVSVYDRKRDAYKDYKAGTLAFGSWIDYILECHFNACVQDYKGNGYTTGTEIYWPSRGSASGDGTICGAIREIIEYIRGVNPSCQIVVIQVTPYTSTNNPFGSASASGWTLNSFDEQVSLLCKNLNVGYASWYGCSLFSKWTDFSGGGGNYAHMKSAEQYVQMGNYIGGQVSRYFHN